MRRVNKYSAVRAMLQLTICVVGIVAYRAEAVTNFSDQIEQLIAEMSVVEKVAQMRIFHAKAGVDHDEQGNLILSDEVKQRLRFGIAGIKNPGEFLPTEAAARLTNQLQRYIIENNRLSIPALFITEAYNGVDATGTTRFGRPINMAATWNPELVESVWDTIGREARWRGLHMCHSPEADIMRDPRFGRMSEAYSEDTHLTSEMVVAAINGVQGRYAGLASTHIGAVTKHFAGYGQVEGGLNFAAVSVSPLDLLDEILPPFKAAVQRGRSLGIMAAHGDINGVASHANRDLLTTTLKRDWGFNGYVVSDANDIARLYFFMGVAKDPDHAALLGLQAGVDIDLYSDDAYARLPNLLAKDPSLLPLIDEAVRRVLRTKFRLGLFEQPYVDVAKAGQSVRTQASLRLARAADAESIILLKNDNNLLPLDKSKLEGKTIALIGPLLNDDTLPKFAAVFGDKVTLTAEQGFELTNRDSHEPALRSRADNKPGMDKALAVARQADLVLLFVGGDEYTAKEAYFAKGLGDRDSIQPVGLQDELLSSLKDMNKPVVVMLKHRRTLAINAIAAKADAILDAWDLSEHGDTVLAQTVLGEINPSGKLPVTVPRSIGQYPFHYSRKNINFKKRYLFTNSDPLFPFGFGLSYTQFSYHDLKLAFNQIESGQSLTVHVSVKNDGVRAGKEVVQLYLQDVIGSVVRPRKVLKAFQKIELQAGEDKRLEFTITPDMLSMTNAQFKRVIEPGEFIVEVGGSSAVTLSQGFSVVAAEHVAQ